MKKTLLTIILSASIIIAGCAPVTTATVPTIIQPISTLTAVIPTSQPASTHTAIPTATISSLPSQVVPTQDETQIKQYQDVRSKNISSFGILGESLIETLWFDQATKFTKQDEPVAKNILELGMNPGMGIRDLHARGITGKGVTVAIIDQPVVSDHPEFKGKIIKYHDVGTKFPKNKGSLHGPAVTSLLVGENIGTAPGAQVYYVAAPSWHLDAQYYADALDWIVAENEKLPADGKIRVVSVSAIPSGIWSEYIHQDAWDQAYQRATDAGLLVLDATLEHGMSHTCHYDLNDPDNIQKCINDYHGPTDSPHKRIYTPARRTSASEDVYKMKFAYQYSGTPGALSWTVPYLAGVLAMGWQVNPRLTGAQLMDMMYASAYVNDDDKSIINPKAFIERVQLTIGKKP